MSLLQVGFSVFSRVSGRYFISAVTLCALLFASVSAQAQTAPTSIVVSPTNPVISTTQTQQFTATSGNTIPLQGIVQISAGDLHTCALLGDGTVRCWGRNDSGQLGDGSNSDSTTPVPVSGLGGVTAISAGEAHSCALLSDGTAKCWGWNGHGQLGNGSTTDSTAPVTVSGLSGATAIAAGGHQTCALLADGTMRCWGGNVEGELGNGTNTDSTIPVTVILPMKPTAISVGFSHACALMADGTARCWGQNTDGELGDGTNTDSNIPVAVSGLSGATAISAGDLPSCAVVGVRAYCWGANPHGELGNGTTTSSNVPVMVVTSGGAASAIAAGTFHVCGLDEGIVSCWGYNQQGQLGDGSTTASPVDVPTTVMLPPGTTATAITAGEYHSCALLGDGTAQCWGSNQYGQLGTGSNVNSDTPVAVVGNVVPGLGANHIAAGADHSCAALADGTAQCWGSNQYGQLGNSSNSDSNTPVTVSGLSGVTAIATGDHHSCAVVANGNAMCWGRGLEGQVGNGLNNLSTQNSPAPVTFGQGSTAISAGAVHSCALIVDGTVKCWGSDTFGQLGIGANNPTNKADQVHGLSQATAVTAGSYHTCAVLADGTAQCWGYNVDGQLGNGSTTDSNLPVSVSLPVGTKATAIAAGGYHTCALLADGTVQCWGYNGDGELGNGTTFSSSLPVTVSLPAGTRATAIAAGAYHTCALLSDGTVRCWGYNGVGELGNGSNVDSNTPVTVSGLSGVKGIAGGLYHTCANLADGTVRCWGYNGNGEFGNGSNTNSNTPVASNALAAHVTWTSDTTSVATIDAAAGLATPISTGTSLITATFGNLTNSTTLTVGIAPQITSANAATFTTGTLGIFTVTTMGSSPTSISKSGSLPSGVIFVDHSDGTATLSGTPAANTGGVYPLMITASNGLLPNATQSFTLTVNQPPAITSANTKTFTVGVAGTTFTVTATGYPASFTFGVTGLPSGLTFNTSTGLLSGTPAAGTGGSYALTFTASNGVPPSATQNFTLNINEAPAMTSGSSVSFKLGTAGNFTVTASGFPIPSISETGTLPAGVTLVDHGDGTATLGGTPHATGTFHVVMKAHNGIGSDATQNFTLTVTKGDTTSKVSGPTYFSSAQVVTLTATVTGGGVTPTGTVKFSTSTTTGYVLGTVTLSGGTATLKTKLPNGTNYVHVDYSGDGNYSPSTSPTIVVRMY